MKKNLWPWLVFAALCTAAALQGLYFSDTLPGTVASHFNAAGLPDSWMSKSEFVTLYFVTIGAAAAILLLCAVAFYSAPARYVNLPNKDYWLAPERRAETLAWLASSFMWFASATQALLIDIFHQVWQVSMGQASRLPHPEISLGLYVAFAVVWLVLLARRFRLPEPQDA